MGSGWLDVAARVALSVWLLSISLWDHLKRRVPNWLVLPVMFAALAWRIYAAIALDADGLGFAAIAWVTVFMLWRLHILGGGDSKFLMAILAIFPSVNFLAFFSVMVLLISIPLVVAKYARRRPADLLASLRARTASGHLLPDEQELQTQGRPYCWTLALPALVYIWLMA